MEKVEQIAAKRNKSKDESSWTDFALSLGIAAAQSAASGALFSLGGIAVQRMFSTPSAPLSLASEEVIHLPRKAGNA